MVFRKILCPVDFSTYSVDALRAASALALQFGGTLTVVHVIAPVPVSAVPGSPTTFNVAEYQRQLVDGYTSKLDDLLSSTLPTELRTSSSRLRSVVVHGDPAYEIVRCAQEESVDLIVLATRGRTGWEHVLFGSVAERVVRLSPCPVLTLRGEQPERSTKPFEGR
jgi:universal stress protein A